MRHITTILFFLLCLLLPSISAQNTNYGYNVLDTENGLSNNSVNCIIQDSRGYMWFSTYYGLNRYNGYEINNFYSTSDDETTLSSNFITKLQEDNDGNIWVGTKFGLNKFDKDTEKFKRYLANSNQPTSLLNNHIGDLLLDSKNQIWIGTMGGGLYCYNKQTDDFSCFAQKDAPGTYINMISAITEGNDGELWVGSYGQGLSMFDTKEQVFINYEFPTMQINSLLDDENGSIWIATDNMGLYRFDKVMKVYERFNLQSSSSGSNLNIILSLTINKDGSLLAAVDGGGIINIDPVKKEMLHNNENNKAHYQLDTKAIYSVYIDSNGLYWVGTIGKGIRIINTERNRFQHYKHHAHNSSSISDNVVLSLLQDSKNRIWVGTDGGGLNLFNKKNESFHRFNKMPSNRKSNVIKRVFEDSEQNIWLGTYGSGLAWFNEQTNELISYNPYSTLNNESISISVWSIAQKIDKRLWIGTLGNGLYEFNTETKVFTHLKDIYPQLNNVMNDYILSLLVDSKKNLWIGTSNGIYVWLKGEEKYIRYLFDKVNDSGVGNNAVLTIYEGSNGQIWVGSNGGGIYKIDSDQGEVINLTTSDGLAQEQVYDICETNDGILWFATQGGLSKYEVETGRFQNYDNRDGLLGSTFNTLLYTKSNQLLVGGVKGLNQFNPKVIKVNNNIPTVILSELYINNAPIKAGDENSPLTKNITETKEIVLNHDQTNISIEFVAINYFISEKNSYSYKLENLENQWSKASSSRIVKYNNLKPGDYIFKVKAANNDGVWSTSETALKIKVLAPWWKRWYTYLAYFILIGGAMYAYIRYTVAWIDLRRKLEFEVMEREKIKELNQMRLQFFTNISHEFRTPLTLISGPLESLKKKLNLDTEEQNLFDIAHKNSNVLLRLINQVMDFRKVESGSMELNVSENDIVKYIKECAESFRFMAQKRQMSFKVNCNVESLKIQFDKEIIEKIIYNLLSNAFKYGKENGQVTLNLLLSDEQIMERQNLSISISDDGDGINSDHPEEVFIQYKRFRNQNQQIAGTGIGLALTKSLVQLHGGKISVESEKGKGTTFTIKLPIINPSVSSSDKQITENIVTEDHTTPDVTTKNPEGHKNSLYNLLIVDDNQQVVNYLQTVLNTDYNVTTASDGQEAFNYLEKLTFDLVITDVMMPVMDGIELCNRIKNEVQTSHIPVIMLTAKTSVDNSIEGLKTGADAYLPKPFNPDLLLAYIDNLLKGREKLKQIFTGNALINPSEITTTSVDEQFVSKALEIVKLNMDNEAFGVEELCQELGMSRSNLHRKIKALTDKSTTDFIRTIRLKEAAAMLASADDQISEIAYKVGFNSSSYFIKSFKKEFSMSPGQYKQAHKRWN